MCPKNKQDSKYHPICEYFIYTIYERYTKYLETRLASISESEKNIPPQAKVLKAIKTFKTKPTESKTFMIFYLDIVYMEDIK